jgi:uncharacterized membrane protein
VNGVYVLILGIGFVAGLRSLTAPAVVAWAAHLGWLDLNNSPVAFMGSTAAVAILTVLALGEFVADKLPATPKRTALPPLLARIVTGALSATCLAVSWHYSLGWAAAGAVGAVAGAFAGYQVRRAIVAKLQIKDLPVALAEDLVAIGLAVFLVSR